MRRRNEILLLGLIYSAAAFFAFAIVRYFYVFLWEEDLMAEDELVTVRVFLSGPMLIILGIFLMVRFKQLAIHRFFGILLLFCGIGWIFEIIKAAIEEAA
ncbi:MAG TPA: hypothetical protein VEW65_14900 [Chryseolinea sp.]|nr:hypothetical protein [Chryseolinea sp.]